MTHALAQVGPVRALLETKAVHHGNIDTGKVSDGFTALCLAALQGQTDVVRLLLRSGAKPQIGTTAGGALPLTRSGAIPSQLRR